MKFNLRSLLAYCALLLSSSCFASSNLNEWDNKTVYLKNNDNNYLAYDNNELNSKFGNSGFSAQWRLKHIENGEYTLQNSGNDRYLTTSYKDNADTQSRITSNLKWSPFQAWKLNKHRYGIYILTNVATNNSLTSESDGKVRTERNNQIPQYWTIVNK